MKDLLKKMKSVKAISIVLIFAQLVLAENNLQAWSEETLQNLAKEFEAMKKELAVIKQSIAKQDDCPCDLTGIGKSYEISLC